MDYYRLFSIIRAGELLLENVEPRNIKDYYDFYFEVFAERTIKPDSDFIFKYKLHDLDDDKLFKELDILNTRNDYIVSDKFIDAIYDDIKDDITRYKAAVSYKDKLYDNYTTFMVNNIIDIFVDTPEEPSYRGMRSRIKKQFINADFDIVMDSGCHVTIFSERLVEKLKAAGVSFDLEKVPYEA